MAMRFSQAQRAENPDMARALTEQSAIANQLKSAEMQREAQTEASYLNAGVNLAVASPDGTFTNAMDTASGANAPINTGAMADPLSGAMASPVPPTGGMDLISGAATNPAMSPVLNPSTGLGAEMMLGGETAAGVAGAGEAAAAAELAGAAEVAGAAGGSGSAALAGMGPMGWGALGALALSRLV